MKALTPNASEMLRDYVSNKKLTANNNNNYNSTNSKTKILGPKKEV